MYIIDPVYRNGAYHPYSHRLPGDNITEPPSRLQKENKYQSTNV